MNKLFLIAAIATLGIAGSASAQSNKSLVGSWTGPYKADCAEPNCAGQVFITIRSDGPNLIAKTSVKAGSSAPLDRGEQPVIAEGNGWSVTYPMVTKVILAGDPASGSVNVTLDPRVDPNRLNAKLGQGTISKK